VLGRIAVPTLLLNARTDPFMPEARFRAATRCLPRCASSFPDQGGHAALSALRFPGI